MPATVSYDEQYCPIARALDVLGGRWTLLILRELAIGDQRFTDLRNHLPGIAPTLLTQRLRAMADEGLVESKELPPPAARSVYAITSRGREAIPVMRALAKWGMPLLEAPDDDLAIRPWTAVFAAVAPFHDPVRSAGIDERYRFRIAGEEIVLWSVNGRGVPADTDAILDLESDPRLWLDIRQGRTTVGAAIDEGRLVVSGDDDALARFQRVFDIA